MNGFRITAVRAYVQPLRTRMPFRFGISEVSRVPHVFVQVELDHGGARATGMAADHLIPKWFTKNPHTGLRKDLDELRAAILSVCVVAREIEPQPTPFLLWRAIYAEQLRRGDALGWPHLLSGFGTSLIERAVIDAACRLQGVSFHAALHTNSLGIDLASIHPELGGVRPADVLPKCPVVDPWIRHTVGLSDPLTPADLAGGRWPEDGLPVCLEDVIARHGVRRFKIKLSASTADNLPRLRALARVLEAGHGADHVFTLDGNESYQSPAAFADFWEQAQADPVLAGWFRRLLFIEQPLHRDCALSGDLRKLMRTDAAMPAVIIDESDCDLDTLPRALAQGYAGTTHKNCKGVFKSVANLALLRRRFPDGGGVFSGEDLTNVGPVALLEDLCVAGCLGLDDLERNGHHYFRGLSGFPAMLQDAVRLHDDLFETQTDGSPILRIRGGRLACASLHHTGLGPRTVPDLSSLPSLEGDWQSAIDSLHHL
jgi:L-alanine-DL-glutamate epimerase-like enolase superfamily enzyme